MGVLSFLDTSQSCEDSPCAGGLVSELSPACALCQLHISGFGDTYTQGSSLGYPSGCGPLTFLATQPLP